MSNKEELNFGKQMDASPDKKQVADLVVKMNRTNVLDLGAGTGIISRLISEHNIHCTAVDNNFKSEDIVDTEYLHFNYDNLIDFVKCAIMYDWDKYDCIILSAVLHELSKKDFNYLKKNLSKIMDDDCVVIIREPYYEKASNYYRPFINKDRERETVKEIKRVTSKKFQRLFNKAPKVSQRRVPNSIKALNMAFTYSYGKDSWDREINEYRYTFKFSDIKKFCDKIFDTNNYVLRQEKFDYSYRKYFKRCGYSEDVLSSIDYTNCLIIAYTAGDLC